MWHVILGLAVAICVWAARPSSAQDNLQREFRDPPLAAQAWCYWWWLNGAASKEGITRDFEEMKKQGIGGALLFDAGEAGPEAPRGPQFMSARVARAVQARRARGRPLRHRLGREPVQRLECRRTVGDAGARREEDRRRRRRSCKGPGHVDRRLCRNRTSVQDFYRDIAVLACPIPDDAFAAATTVGQFQYRRLPSRAGRGWAGRHALDLQRRQARHGPDAGEARVSAVRLRPSPGRPPGCT